MASEFRRYAEVLDALRCTLNDYLEHGGRVSRGAADVFSTGHYFDCRPDHGQEKSPRAPDSYVSPPGCRIAVLWKRYQPPIPLGPGH